MLRPFSLGHIFPVVKVAALGVLISFACLTLQINFLRKDDMENRDSMNESSARQRNRASAACTRCRRSRIRVEDHLFAFPIQVC
jgi:hypothetical protein